MVLWVSILTCTVAVGYLKTRHDIMEFNSPLLNPAVKSWTKRGSECLNLCMEYLLELEIVIKAGKKLKGVFQFFETTGRCDCYFVDHFIFAVTAASILDNSLFFVESKTLVIMLQNFNFSLPFLKIERRQNIFKKKFTGKICFNKLFLKSMKLDINFYIKIELFLYSGNFS